MKFLKIFSPFILKLLGGVSPLILSLFCGTSASIAAENIVLKVGLLQHKIPVSDLQKFADNQEISATLKPYNAILNPETQQVLSKSFKIDSLIAEQFLKDLLKSDDGKRLLEQISEVLSDSNSSELEEALKLLLKQTNNLSIINFLRVYPKETVTIDISKAAILSFKVNGSFLHSKLISSQLDKSFKNSLKPDITPQFDPTKSGEQIISITTDVLYDRSRDRYITLDIYTADKTRGPLVIMSHGFASDRRFLRYLGRHLASYGITVVSV